MKLVVYDVLGREVSVLVYKNQRPGNYQVEFDPSAQGLNLSSGIYYYQLLKDNRLLNGGSFHVSR